MGYYIRILGKSLAFVSLRDLQKAAEPAILEADPGVGDEWERLILKHQTGTPIAFIEKNPIADGTLGSHEIKEFWDEVSYYKPESAVAWLKLYFPTVRVIYSFQLLSGTEFDDGMALMHQVYGALWRSAGGILQADQEGFTDEEGYAILWQFASDVTGSWNAAVLDKNGQWIHYEIDLESEEHREAFWRGELPTGVSPKV